MHKFVDKLWRIFIGLSKDKHLSSKITIQGGAKIGFTIEINTTSKFVKKK